MDGYKKVNCKLVVAGVAEEEHRAARVGCRRGFAGEAVTAWDQPDGVAQPPGASQQATASVKCSSR